MGSRALGGTIVAHASGPGHSTRAVVRLSGPDAQRAVAALAAGSSPEAEAAVDALRARGVHRVTLALRVHGMPCACPALALSMPGPRSFTGEDCVELLLPGNPALADAAVEALLGVPGVAAAAPGAFMARAHAAGRIAVADAERIALEIGAASAGELEAARQVQANPLVQSAHVASAAVAELLARVEAGIDFADSEDVIAIARGEAAARAAAVREGIMRWIEGSVPIESMSALPVVALRGAPNAGKSSLFNALLGRARAVESPLAGTTRDAIAEEIELKPAAAGERGAGISALLVDTPGIEDPRSAIDALMQEQARSADRADVVLLCEPLAMMSGAPTECPDNAIRVATRSDEAAGRPIHAPAGVICTSAVTGSGVAELADAIAARIAARRLATSSAHRIAALGRHREAMSMAARWLADGIDAARHGTGDAMARPELVAHALRGALDALGEVTGATTPDDVLGLVFSRFCIGK